MVPDSTGCGHRYCISAIAIAVTIVSLCRLSIKRRISVIEIPVIVMLVPDIADIDIQLSAKRLSIPIKRYISFIKYIGYQDIDWSIYQLPIHRYLGCYRLSIDKLSIYQLSPDRLPLYLLPIYRCILVTDISVFGLPRDESRSIEGMRQYVTYTFHIADAAPRVSAHFRVTLSKPNSFPTAHLTQTKKKKKQS